MPQDRFEFLPGQTGVGQIYELELRGDRTYRIDMTADRPLDSYLIVTDAGGNVLARDDDSGGNLNARIFFSPPATGKYRIICTSFSRHDIGNFVLTVVEEPRGGFAVQQPMPGFPPEFKPAGPPRRNSSTGSSRSKRESELPTDWRTSE